ncbi:MAG TPA: hypothetical protein DEP69_01715, partial [Acidimicrobiaceae bacterium]|nr:hypothetical protein [Acidimicrobiaceae bacterium]
THRGERYQRTSRKPAVAFSTDVRVDLGRRDFTVNAMALELPSRRLIDPCGGFDDLARRVLRAPDDPRRLFDEDPLRILRAARFAAVLGLRPQPDVVAAMTTTCERLEIVAAERISVELEKLLTAPAPGEGVALLARTGVLEFLGVLRASTEQAADGPDIGTAVDATTPVHELRWAVLLRLGGHDGAGARAVLDRLRHSADVGKRVAAILGALEDLTSDAQEPDAQAQEPRARALLARRHGHVDDAVAVAEAVGLTTDPELLDTLRRVESAEGVPRLGSPLDGDAVIELAGRHGVEISGPQIGEALRFLLA